MFCTPFFGLWWVFPLMFIVCMIVMFLVMRGFCSGRFPCCFGHMGQDSRGDAQTDTLKQYNERRKNND